MAATPSPAADPSPLAVDGVRVDPLCRTTTPGVFAAGDVSTQVAAAIAAGSLAATAVVQSLLAEDVGLPFPSWSARVDA